MEKTFYGADEFLLPTQLTARTGIVSADELFGLAMELPGRVIFPCGYFVLTDDLILNKNDTCYDFASCTLVSDCAKIILSGERSIVMLLSSYAKFEATSKAAFSAITRCRFGGSVSLDAPDLIVKQNLFEAPVSFAAEGQRVTLNTFDDAEISVAHASYSLFAHNNLIMSSISLCNGENITVMKNSFDESPENTTITADSVSRLSLINNSCDGRITLKSCRIPLCCGNGTAPYTENCFHPYGSDFDCKLPEHGADFASLPIPDNRRFSSRAARDYIYELVSEAGLLKKLPFSEYLTGAIKSRSEAIIPPGVYSLDCGLIAHICLSGISDFKLYGYGALIITSDFTRSAVAMINCHAVGLYGITFDTAEVSNTQGTVFSTDKDSIVWLPDEGYPGDICNPAHYSTPCAAEGYRAGSDRPYRDLGAVEKRPCEDVPGGVYVGFSSPHTLKPGDKVIYRGLFANVNLLIRCSRIVYEDVTLHSGSGFGFMEYGGSSGTVLRRLLFTPGPPPTPTSPERLISVCDATHSTNMREGIKVFDSYFEKMTDDATNINGSYSDITSVKKTDTGSEIFYGTGTSNYSSLCADFKTGDEVLIYTREGKFIAREKALSPTIYKNGGMSVLISGFFELEEHTVCENASANGDGFVFENCLLRNNRSRGLLIKAMNGVLRNCTLSDNGMSAILVKPEISDGWGECGFSWNVTIEKNHLINGGYFTGSELHSPINISGDSPPCPDRRYHNHSNIKVVNNLIEGRYTEYAITANSVNGLEISSNTILPRVGEYSEFKKPSINTLADVGDDNIAPIHVVCCDNVTIENNIIPPSSEAEAIVE